MLNKYLAIAVLCLSFTACKKKEEKAPEAKPTEAAKPADKPADQPADKPADKPAAGKTIANADEYTKLGMEMMDKMTAIFADAGKDCDKLATNLTKFNDENQGMKEATEAFEKANPDVKKAFDEKAKASMEKFMQAAGPAMEACKDHAGVKTAMEKMAS